MIINLVINKILDGLVKSGVRFDLKFWLKPNGRFNKQAPAKVGGNSTITQFNFNAARF